MKFILQHVLFAALLGVSILIVACKKTTTETNEALVTEATDEALYAVQERGGIGKLGCYELIFPVTIELPDATTAVVNDYQEMKNVIRAWYTANGTGGGSGTFPHGGNRFQFVYPISVLNDSGDVITVNNKQELHDLRADCPGGFSGHGGGHHGHGGGHHGHGNHLRCFDFVFPVTISFPDGTTASAASGSEMRQLISDWRKNNPGVQGRPQLVFPVTVRMVADSSLVVVNNKMELRQLKKDCN